LLDIDDPVWFGIATAIAITTTSYRFYWPAKEAAGLKPAATDVPKDTPLTNLYLAMLDRAGYRALIGDSTGQLTLD